MQKQHLKKFIHLNDVNKLGTERNFFQLIRASTKNSTANITLNGKRLKAFSLRLGKRQEYLLLSLLFNIVLEVLAKEISQEKEIQV